MGNRSKSILQVVPDSVERLGFPTCSVHDGLCEKVMLVAVVECSKSLLRVVQSIIALLPGRETTFDNGCVKFVECRLQCQWSPVCGIRGIAFLMSQFCYADFPARRDAACLPTRVEGADKDGHEHKAEFVEDSVRNAIKAWH